MTPTFYCTSSSSSVEDTGATGTGSILLSYLSKQEDQKCPTTNVKQANQMITSPLYYPLSVSTQCFEQQQKDVLEIAKAVCPWLLLKSPADRDDSDDHHNNKLLEEEEDSDEIKSSSSSSSSTPTNEVDDDIDDDSVEEKELLRVRPMLGGLSNALYIVEQKPQPKQHPEQRTAVLVRIHPDTTAATSSGNNTKGQSIINDDNENSDSIVDRPTETKLVTWLASQPVVPPLAPAVYGRFRNGRVEEFYDNMRPLSSDEMPRHAAAIGHRLAQLHRLTENVRPLHIFPPEQQPASNNTSSNPPPLPGAMWELTEKWYRLVLKTLEQQQKQQPSSSSATDIVAVLKDWEKAWQWTRTAFQQHYKNSTTANNNSNNNTTAATHFCQQIVLAHMDCQSLNLLIPVEQHNHGRNQSNIKSNNNNNNHHHDNHDNHMRVIDYEYSGLNPRAADIANTFCEMCKMNEIQADWEQEYPSQETQDKLLRAYMHHLEHRDGDAKEDGNEKDNCTHIALSDLRHEVGRYTLVSHLSWTVWALLYAAQQLSKCDIHNEDEGCFNYLAYAQQRMDGYRYFRARFWETDRS